MGIAKQVKSSVAKRSRARAQCGLEGLESRVLLTGVPHTLLSQVISFPGQENGGGGKYPSSLIADAAGDLFGTTELGGANNYGTIFEVPAGTSSIVTLASFAGPPQGFTPKGKLVLIGTTLYGATSNGGANNLGSLYSFDLATHAITTLFSFTGGVNGAHPSNGIASDGAGDFFGTTYGGINDGGNQNSATIFEYTLGTGAFQTLVTLPQGIHIDTGVALDPATGLVALTGGPLALGQPVPRIVYASTTHGGVNTDGSIISYTVNSGATVATTVASFDQTHGGGPIGTLYYVANADAAGDPGIVGATAGGGADGIGTLFDIPLVGGAATGTISLLGSFHGGAGGRPNGTLILVDSANTPTDHLLGNTLYGTTADGGNGDGYGAVFKLPNATPVGTGFLIPAFTNQPFNFTTGIHPSAGLVLMPDGTLVGTLSARAKYVNGSLFELSTTAPPATPNHLVFGTLPSKSTAGVILGATAANAAGGLSIKIENAAGHVVTSDNSNVTLQVATGPGSFTPVTVAAVNGVATFTSLVLTKSGTYNLLATDGAAHIQSNNITVAAGAAAALAIASQPTVSTTTSRLNPLVVHVEDAFGNVVTADHSSVTLAVATGAGALAGTTSVAAKAGVATFNALSLASAGAYTLKATDGALTAATSATITAGLPATHLAFTNLLSTESQNPEIQVALLDANGNVAASSTGTVKLVLGTHPAGAKLFGTASAAILNGVATFDLSLFKLGPYTLKAMDGKLAVTSALFEVAASAQPG
jgi:uncharacterized repeat protein (TIGR03803 family)